MRVHVCVTRRDIRQTVARDGVLPCNAGAGVDLANPRAAAAGLGPAGSRVDGAWRFLFVFAVAIFCLFIIAVCLFLLSAYFLFTEPGDFRLLRPVGILIMWNFRALTQSDS